MTTKKIAQLDSQPFPTLQAFVGNTPLIRLQRLSNNPTNTILLKLEGNNPAGSVKDRPATNMIEQAEKSGHINHSKLIIEPTSGNTGIALAMVAAIKGFRIRLVMPEHMSLERRQVMETFGAEIVLTPEAKSMEGTIDAARAMVARNEGVMLDQFNNPHNPESHYKSTGPEIWRDTRGTVTHFVSSMGTTGTIMGVSRYLKEKNQNIQIIGVQPMEGANIPGIRRWPKEYLPKIFEPKRVDQIIDIDQPSAEQMTHQLAAVEGVFAGMSSGGAVAAALQLSSTVNNALIVVIVCDRGDRYLSTGLFDKQNKL